MEVLETTGLTTELTHHSHVQVDESLLTEDCPPPPYMAMTLPGGPTMNLPMDPVRTGADSPDTDSTTTATTALGQDVLSVTAGEPATHFNLDQLLNIVQSFQLDTTHAHTGDPCTSRTNVKVCVTNIFYNNITLVIILNVSLSVGMNICFMELLK